MREARQIQMEAPLARRQPSAFKRPIIVQKGPDSDEDFEWLHPGLPDE
ncbi:hypothetical protein AVEN_157545-1, partial [Araneus ventricosus]